MLTTRDHLMIIMSMGWGYVSELRPPTGLLFVPQGDKWAWRIMVEWYRQRQLPIRPSKLSGKPTSSHLVAYLEELGEGNY
jgi:hypothetical protein